MKKHYIFLEEGDQRKRGDEVFKNGEWVKIYLFGPGCYYQSSQGTFRREVKVKDET